MNVTNCYSGQQKFKVSMVALCFCPITEASATKTVLACYFLCIRLGFFILAIIKKIDQSQKILQGY